VVAVRGAEGLPEGDLKSLLLSNESCLRSGAVGPDLFLFPPGGNTYPSDLAHYCKTDVLAKNFLNLSKRRSPRAQAFGYGWFSHNIGDAVALGYASPAEAGEKLGRIQSLDLGPYRTTLGHLIAAWERSSYEWILARLSSRPRRSVTAGRRTERPDRRHHRRSRAGWHEGG
jgi:hypothetical protein